MTRARARMMKRRTRRKRSTSKRAMTRARKPSKVICWFPLLSRFGSWCTRANSKYISECGFFFIRKKSIL